MKKIEKTVSCQIQPFCLSTVFADSLNTLETAGFASFLASPNNLHDLQLPASFADFLLTSAARTASSCSSCPHDRAWWACRWWRTHPSSGRSSPHKHEARAVFFLDFLDMIFWYSYAKKVVRFSYGATMPSVSTSNLRLPQAWSPQWCTACRCTRPPRCLGSPVSALYQWILAIWAKYSKTYVPSSQSFQA